MIESLIGQLVGTVMAGKKRAIEFTLTRIALVLAGALFVVGGLSFALVAIYHALTPRYFPPIEAAGIMSFALLALGGILVAIAIRARPRPSVPAERPDLQSPELSAIAALGMLNKALTDISKNRAGASPYLGLLGLAALVGFVSGRKR